MQQNRRTFVKTVGAATTGALFGSAFTGGVSAAEVENRFIVDVGDQVNESDRTRLENDNFEIVHDLEPIGYLVVRGDESTLDSIVEDFAPDVRYEIDVSGSSAEMAASSDFSDQGIDLLPKEGLSSDDIQSKFDRLGIDPDEAVTTSSGEETPAQTDAFDLPDGFDVPENYDYQYDKQHLEFGTIASEYDLGTSARIGIVDSGIGTYQAALGDLTNTRQDLSQSFVSGDNQELPHVVAMDLPAEFILRVPREEIPETFSDSENVSEGDTPDEALAGLNLPSTTEEIHTNRVNGAPIGYVDVGLDATLVSAIYDGDAFYGDGNSIEGEDPATLNLDRRVLTDSFDGFTPELALRLFGLARLPESIDGGVGRFEYPVDSDGLILNDDFFSPAFGEFIGPFWSDPRYHGTHVAGIAAAESGGLVSGLAPGAEVVSLRTNNLSGSGAFGDIFAAITYGATPESEGGAGCDVLNTSLGTPPLVSSRSNREFLQTTLQDVADYCLENDVVWTTSAGNAGTNITRENRVVFPASAAGNIIVSATAPTGYVPNPDGLNGATLSDPVTTPASYTDYGAEYVDVSAPGGDGPARGDLIWSTSPRESLFTDADLVGLAGTSMAAPQVAGQAALIRSNNPELSAREIIRLIKRTADDAGPRTYHGYGYINPLTSLQGEDPVQSRIDRPGGRRDDRSRSDREEDGEEENEDDSRGRGDDNDDDSGRSGRGRGSDNDDDGDRGGRSGRGRDSDEGGR